MQKLPIAVADVSVIAFDFDGVLTDNRVYVFEDGREAVCCNRGDGLAFDLLRKENHPTIIISTETNKVVSARAMKLGVFVVQSSGDKIEALEDYCAANGLDPDAAMFVGNDINDLAVMRRVGFPVAVANAHPAVIKAAKFILETDGGDGVAREIVERLVAFPSLET